MISKFESIRQFVKNVDPNSVFVEIGSDRGDGSTSLLADLAQQHTVELLTVDINDKATLTPEEQLWDRFYNNIKDESWPTNITNIDQLPDSIKNECLEVFKWNLEAKKIYQEQHNSVDLKNHPSIVWHTGVAGSDWCKNYSTVVNKKISLLLLDNFDYINNTSDLAPHEAEQVIEYREKYNIDMNNQNCQIEHFTQALYLIPHLTNNAIVVFDDTYLYNDCWIGKCGPVVVYLQSLGFEILRKGRAFPPGGTVILQNTKYKENI